MTEIIAPGVRRPEKFENPSSTTSLQYTTHPQCHGKGTDGLPYFGMHGTEFKFVIEVDPQAAERNTSAIKVGKVVVLHSQDPYHKHSLF